MSPPPDGPAVLAFGGHRLHEDAVAGATLGAEVQDVVAGLAPGEAHGSLACGADILWAEAAAAAGADLHLVLPFDLEPFLAASVRPGGSSWEGRARDLLAAAASVSVAAAGPYRGDVSYALAALRFLGRARLQAAGRGVEAAFAVVWDGSPSAGPAGTGADVARWRAVGGELRCLAPRGSRVRGGGVPPAGPAVQVGAVCAVPANREGRAREMVAAVEGPAVRVAVAGDRVLLVTSVRAALVLARAGPDVGPLVVHGGLVPLRPGEGRTGALAEVTGWAPTQEGAGAMTAPFAALAAMVPGEGVPVAHGTVIGAGGKPVPAYRPGPPPARPAPSPRGGDRGG